MSDRELLPSCEKELERIHLAVVKLAMSGVQGIEIAEELYKVDYRDFLVDAGFGSDIKARNKWANSLI